MGAERDHRRDAEGVVNCKLCRVVEAPYIQPFPDPSHAHNVSPEALPPVTAIFSLDKHRTDWPGLLIPISLSQPANHGAMNAV